MIKKIFRLLVVASLPTFVFCTSDECPLYNGGFYMGVGFAPMVKTMDGELVVGYCNEYCLAELGYNYLRFTRDPRYNSAYTLNLVAARIGGRSRINNMNLFVSYGVGGNYGFMSDEQDTPALRVEKPYGIGGFVGLEYQFNEHYLIAARSNIYSYIQTIYRKGIKHQVFGLSSMNVSYVF